MTESQGISLGSRFAKFDNIDLSSVGASLGRGAAIRLGLNRVTEAFVAILSLEDRVETAEIAAGFSKLEAERSLDCIVGYRAATSAGETISRPRHWRSRTYSAFVDVLLNTGVTDVQSPLKIFRTPALRSILDDLQLFDHGFDADLMYNARRRGLRLFEKPIHSRRMVRRWPLLPTAFRAVLSVLSLRLLNSRLGRNNIVRLLGRPAILPKKKRYDILIFCWRDPLSPKAGGGEVYLYEQAKCWVEQGHRVTWVAQMYPGAKKEESIAGINVLRRGYSLFVFARAAIWYVFQSGWQFDFIIDTMNGFPFFTPLFSRKPKVCLLYHVHAKHFRDELPEPLATLAVAIETKVVPFIYRRTRFVTISDSSANDIREIGITPLPLKIIYSGVSSDLVPGRKHVRPTILFVGRLRRYKQLRKLIDAFRILKGAVPEARLVIAGTGDDESSLKAYCANENDVIFTGRVDNATKVALMQEAWVFGMPSSLEGWGIVVIEAACCGTPAVAFDVNGLRDCIVNGATGFLAHTDVEFAQYLERLLTDNWCRQKMSERCIGWGSHFSWEATAARTLDEIRRVQPWSVVFESDRPENVDIEISEERLLLASTSYE